MRLASLFLASILLAGCAGPPTAPGTVGDGGTPTFSAPPPLMTCNTPAGATPVRTVPTHPPGSNNVSVLVAHRDSVAVYRADGSHAVTAPSHELVVGFSNDLGYRFVDDASAVYDDTAIHRFDASLRRLATWNATEIGGVVHHEAHYFAVAAGQLHTLDEKLVSLHALPVPGWAPPAGGHYDALAVAGSHLVVATSGRSDAVLVFDISDPAAPRLVKEITLPPRDGAGGQATSAGAFFSSILSTPDQVAVWRDATSQGAGGDAANRMQDLIVVRRADWSVQGVYEQYVEEASGPTRGGRIGPVDAEGAWALHHVRGIVTLANMVHNETGVFPGCQIDIQTSSFSPDDTFFDAKGQTAVTGTQNRASAWKIGADPARLAEIEFPKVGTDVRVT